jgi:Flp pilus assembly protein TadD
MKISNLIVMLSVFLPLLAYAEDKKAEPDLQQPISKEIGSLSNKEIFGRIKKSIKPITIDETNNDISILYDSPKKLLNSSGLKKTSVDISVKKTDPDDITDLIAAGYKAATSGQLEAALYLYKKALKGDYDNTNVLFAIAALYHKLHQVKEARIYYKKLLYLDPDYQKALNNYLVLLSDDSPAQALTELSDLEKENPEYSPVQAQIGMIYAKMGDYISAEKYLKRAVVLSPQILHYRYNLAVVYDNMMKFREAVAVYKQLINAADTGEQELPQSTYSIKQRMTYLQEKLASER